MQGVSISRAIAIAASTIFKRTSCIKKSTGGLAKDLELVGRLKSSEVTRLVTRMTRMNLLLFPDRTCTNNIEYNIIMNMSNMSKAKKIQKVSAEAPWHTGRQTYTFPWWDPAMTRTALCSS